MIRRVILRVHWSPCLCALALAALAGVAGACAAGSEAPPATPTGLKAVAGNQAVTISWQTDSDPDVSTTLYWSESSPVDQSATPILEVRSPFVHDGLENGRRIYYRVLAQNEFGSSPLSSEVSATPRANATSPGAPASLTAVAGDGKVTLSWSAVPGATRYSIYRDTNPGVRPSLSTAVGEGSSPFSDPGLQNGVTYYYVVAAWVSDVRSPPSAEVEATPTAQTTLPPAPTKLVATAQTGAVSLSWEPVTGADSYTLYWSSTPGVTPQNGTPLTGVTSGHLHGSLQNGQTYHYVVTATVGGLESGPSNAASATPTGTTAPMPPQNVTATAGDKQVSLSWSPVAGAVGYTVYWATAPGVAPASGAPLSAASASLVHSPLQNGQTYYYVVTTRDASGESGPSVEVSATPSGSVVAPGSVSSTLSGGAYPIVLLENVVTGTGVVQLLVYSSDPKASPAGTPVAGLSVSVSGAASGALTPSGSPGVYSANTASPLAPGSYTFSVSGVTSGTVTAVVNTMPTCTITAPMQGASHQAGQDLPVTWISTNSQKASILLVDSQGQVTYPPLDPDPGGALVPGADIPYKGALSIVVSASWSAKSAGNTAGLLLLGGGGVQITLQ